MVDIETLLISSFVDNPSDFIDYLDVDSEVVEEIKRVVDCETYGEITYTECSYELHNLAESKEIKELFDKIIKDYILNKRSK